MMTSRELNELWRNFEISAEDMQRELLEHDYLRQYEVERLAAICHKSARQIVQNLVPMTVNRRKYMYLTSEVRTYLHI